MLLLTFLNVVLFFIRMVVFSVHIKWGSEHYFGMLDTVIAANTNNKVLKGKKYNIITFLYLH